MPTIIATTWSSITVPVLDKQFGSNPERGNGGLSGQTPGAQATVYYYLHWADRWTFVQQVMGTPQASDFASPASISYRTPLQYPDNPALYASSFEITPIPSPSGNSSLPSATETAYSYAIVGITYATPTYAMTGANALLTIEGSASAQEITVPLQSYSFSDGSRPEQAVGILIPNQDINITFHRVPFLNTDLFTGYCGTVNSATFQGLSAGNVLCNPISWSTAITVGELPLYDVQFSFSWRSVPWNNFLRADGVFDVLTTGSGDPVFASTDFNQLFS